MEYEFRDLVDIPKLQKLMDEFYNLTKIPHGLLDPDGNILTVTGWQDICTKFHRVNPKSELRCKESDLSIKNRLDLNKDYGVYVCRNGLIEAFTPIIVEGKHIATLFLGQFLHSQPDLEYFRSQAQELGFDVDAYLEALERVPVIPEDKIESCMKYFARLAEMLSYMGLNQLKQKEAEESLLKTIQFVFQDITDRKKMEEELLKTSKLESVSVLAGGIAHDFNNILTILLGNISLARVLVNSEDKIYQKLMQIENATLQAKDLTMQLLTFAKGGTPLKEIVSIGKIIKESAAFALSGSNVRCEFDIPGDLWLLEIDVGQFTQVINNLVINADQAMSEGGIIKIRAENVTVAENQVLPIKAGDYVKISIADQGLGIPEENLQKIFDPYFTTKSGGSGLGLATSYSIIMKHGGYITLESKTGAGTTFYIYLPASVHNILSKNEENQPFFSGKGRILVMDDQAEIRRVLGEMLTLLGYEADFAKDGEEAIELYQGANELGYPFDAVIMDLTIPGGMGGKEAVRRLHEHNPNVKVIVSSGYSNDPVMANFSEYGFQDFVSKPYCVEDLSKVLHKVIVDAAAEASVAVYQISKS